MLPPFCPCLDLQPGRSHRRKQQMNDEEIPIRDVGHGDFIWFQYHLNGYMPLEYAPVVLDLGYGRLMRGGHCGRSLGSFSPVL
jgi:hypothetical protein